MQIEKDMRYWQLAARKKRISLTLTAIALGSFLVLAILATWAPDLLGRGVVFGLNIGHVLVLLVFFLCALMAFIYQRIAEQDFDVVVTELQQDVWRSGGRR